MSKHGGDEGERKRELGTDELFQRQQTAKKGIKSRTGGFTALSRLAG